MQASRGRNKDPMAACFRYLWINIIHKYSEIHCQSTCQFVGDSRLTCIEVFGSALKNYSPFCWVFNGTKLANVQRVVTEESLGNTRG